MNIIYSRIESTESTNMLAMANATNALENSIYVFSAAFQTAGRGQGNHSWEASAGENILASFLVKNPPVSVANQFSLSHTIALAAHAYVSKEIPNAQISIKWPNDIYADGRKIAGILIENAMMGSSLKASVMGIGLNVNQKLFPAGLENAVSLAMLDGKERIVDEEIEKLSAEFETQYGILIHGRTDMLHHFYDNYLLHKGNLQRFLLDGKPIDCRILGTDPDGKIQLLMPDGSKQGFYHHEIEWGKY